jgi:6-phosphogluconolactonase
MRFVVRYGLRATLLALTALTVGVASASASSSPIVGHVYVNDNTAGTNTIAAFGRTAGGTLVAVPGSPFEAGGAGTGAGIASQGSLQQALHGRYLIAADGGSNQVSVLRVDHSGALSRVSDGVVGSGGSDPVSIAVHGHLVYVANAVDPHANYTGFWLSGDGHLRAIPDSTFALPEGSQPGDVLFNRPGTVLAGTRVLSGEIDSFKVGHSGRLTPAPGSPIASQGPGPFGSEFRPTNPNQLFVSNAHGGTGNGTVSAFSVNGDGALTSIGTSPFADLQTAPCWVEISHDGSVLFTVNTAVGTISRYRIEPGGSLVLIGSTPMHEPMGLGPEDARLSPNGESLWVVDAGRKAISGFAVHGSSLSEFGSSPTALPADAFPAGMVVN